MDRLRDVALAAHRLFRFEVVTMRRIALLSVLCLHAVPVAAQGGDPSAEIPRKNVQGYLYLSGGTFLDKNEFGFGSELASEAFQGEGTLEFGGGVDWLFYRGLGVGADVSFMGFFSCFDCDPMAAPSVYASYHWIEPTRRVVPFVVGGAGAILNEFGGEAVANFGGGVNYRFLNGRALRIEFRARHGAVTHMSLRFGFTF